MSEERAKKWKETRIKNLGGLKAYNEFYKKQGKRVGSVKHPKKGFGSNPELAKEMGKKYGGDRK